MEVGIGPEKKFPWTYRLRREARDERSEGNGPERALNRRLRVRSWVKLPMVFCGIWPERPIPGRWSSTTRLDWHMIPAQEHGGPERFHRRDRPPMEDRRAKSTALSAARSGLMVGKRGRRENMTTARATK